MNPEITQEDKDKLQALNQNQQREDRIVEDPVDLSPEWDVYKGKLTKKSSEEMVQYAKDNTIREAAERYNVSKRTVEVHMQGEIKWANATHIDSGRCAVMRLMAQDGVTMREIADRFGCDPACVMKHVSATTSRAECKCDTEIDRVDYS